MRKAGKVGKRESRGKKKGGGRNGVNKEMWWEKESKVSLERKVG